MKREERREKREERREKREEGRGKREEGKTEKKRVIQETHLCVSGRRTPSLGI